MTNDYEVAPVSTDNLIIGRVPIQPLDQKSAYNLAAWLVALGKRLEGGESFTKTLKQVERHLDGQ